MITVVLPSKNDLASWNVQVVLFFFGKVLFDFHTTIMLRLTQKLVSKSVNKNVLNATRFVVAKPVSFVPQLRSHSHSVQPKDETEVDYSNYPMHEHEGGLGDEFNDEYFPDWLRNYQGWEEEFYTDQPQSAINAPDTK